MRPGENITTENFKSLSVAHPPYRAFNKYQPGLKYISKQAIAFKRPENLQKTKQRKGIGHNYMSISVPLSHTNFDKIKKLQTIKSLMMSFLTE